jgi:O-antigen/teichoic acid export membrane protein
MNRLIKSTATLMSGTLFAQTISIAAAPIITRIFSPENYGLLGIYIAVTTIPIMLATGRYHVAIVLPKDDKKAVSLYVLACYILFFITLVTALLAGLLADKISALVGMPQLASLLWLAPFSVFLRGYYQTLQYYSNRKERYTAMAFAQTSDSLLGSALIIGLGIVVSNSADSLVIGRIGGAAAAVFVLVSLVFRANVLKTLFEAKVQDLTQVALEYKKFPLVSSWALLLNTLAFIMPIILLGFYFDAAVVGLYALADRIVITPLSIVGKSVAQVFYRRTAKIERSENLVKAITLLVEKLSLIAAIPLFFLMFNAVPIFGVVFGAEWVEAGYFVQILAPYALVRFVVAPLTNIALVIGKQELELRFNVVLLLGRIIAIYIGGINQDIALALVLLSCASVVSYIFLLLSIAQKTKISTMTLITPAAYNILGSLIVVCAMYALVGNETWVAVTASLLLSGLIYVIWLYYSNRELIHANVK